MQGMFEHFPRQPVHIRSSTAVVFLDSVYVIFVKFVRSKRRAPRLCSSFRRSKWKVAFAPLVPHLVPPRLHPPRLVPNCLAPTRLAPPSSRLLRALSCPILFVGPMGCMDFGLDRCHAKLRNINAGMLEVQCLVSIF